VRVEVDERDRTVLGSMRPKQRQRHRVITAERDDSVDLSEQLGRCTFDGRHRGGDVERVAVDVACVDDLVDVPGLDIEERVVRTEQLRPCADAARTEARTRSVGDSCVERDTHQRHRRRGHI
jgi:hypothetical protein